MTGPGPAAASASGIAPAKEILSPVTTTAWTYLGLFPSIVRMSPLK